MSGWLAVAVAVGFVLGVLVGGALAIRKLEAALSALSWLLCEPQSTEAHRNAQQVLVEG